jgi:hypothetical protein
MAQIYNYANLEKFEFITRYQDIYLSGHVVAQSFIYFKLRKTLAYLRYQVSTLSRKAQVAQIDFSKIST